MISPDGRKLLRVEARNASVPIERKPEWIKTRVRTGPEFTAMRERVSTSRATCTSPHSHQARLPLSLTNCRSATAALRPIVAIDP